MILNKTISFGEENVSGVIVPAVRKAAIDPDEARFIESLKTGDTVAFETLVALYTRDIYGVLYRLTENAEEAGDLTQETFLRAFRSIKGFRGESGLKTWLYRIAINESRNRFRWWKRRRRETTISIDASLPNSNSSLGETLIDRSMSPEEEALRREREYALRAALSGLSDTYREAVVLCDIEGLSYEETAHALDVTIGTVKSRISRGRDELRRKLRDL
jgi:RNA polymerase sigma-70 factor, ECF subfamily